MKTIFKIIILLGIINMPYNVYCIKKITYIPFKKKYLNDITKVIELNGTQDKKIKTNPRGSAGFGLLGMGIIYEATIEKYMGKFGSWDFNKEFDKMFMNKLKGVNFLPIMENREKESEVKEAYKYIRKKRGKFTHIYEKTGVETLLLYTVRYTKLEEDYEDYDDVFVLVEVKLINTKNNTYFWKRKIKKGVRLKLDSDWYWKNDAKLLKDIFMRIADTMTDLFLKDLTRNKEYKVKKLINNIVLYYKKTSDHQYKELQDLEIKKYIRDKTKLTSSIKKQLNDILKVKAYKLQADAIIDMKYVKGKDDYKSYIKAVGKAIEYIY